MKFQVPENSTSVRVLIGLLGLAVTLLVAAAGMMKGRSDVSSDVESLERGMQADRITRTRLETTLDAHLRAFNAHLKAEEQWRQTMLDEIRGLRRDVRSSR